MFVDYKHIPPSEDDKKHESPSDNLTSNKLIGSHTHCKSIMKLRFRTLPLRYKNDGLCLVYITYITPNEVAV